MNPTPEIVTALDSAPDAMPIWWVFPALLGIVFLVYYALRAIDRHNAKRALDAAKAKAEAEKERIDEAMFAHLPPEASEYHRSRLALHMACLRAGRPDLIVSAPPRTHNASKKEVAA